jgi:hypothetical protein
MNLATSDQSIERVAARHSPFYVCVPHSTSILCLMSMEALPSWLIWPVVYLYAALLQVG